MNSSQNSLNFQEKNIKKRKSKISLLIEKEIHKKSLTDSLNELYNESDSFNSISTDNSSFVVSPNINYKQAIKIFYSLDNVNYSNVEIIISENDCVKSMISYAIDMINADLERKNFNMKLNENEELYELRFSKKNGKPKFEYPYIDNNSKVKDLSKFSFTLICNSPEEFLLKRKKIDKKNNKYIKKNNEFINDKNSYINDIKDNASSSCFIF